MPDTYRERLTAPPAWWIGAACFAVAIGWIVLVATTWTIAIVATLVAAALTMGLVAKVGAVTVEASPQGLRVGDAFLDTAHIGAVQALDHTTYRLQLGPQANALAFLMTKPYLDRGIKVEVADADDPTPYWLISSRRPQALADALAGRVSDHGSIPAPIDKGPA